MGKLITGLVLAVILIAVGAGLFLAFWNPPVPAAPVVKVLPDARFPK